MRHRIPHGHSCDPSTRRLGNGTAYEIAPNSDSSYQKTRPYVVRNGLTTIGQQAEDRGDMTTLFPLQLFVATFAAWVTRHQAQAIEYLIEENRVLKEQLGG